MGAVEIKIVIPSHLRADRVITTGCISHAVICVPDSQREEYERHNPNNEVVCHPDSIRGLTLKRQWIYEHFPNVFMIDDDIHSINRLYVEKGEEAALTAEQAYDVVQYIGNCAKLAGCYLFGLSKEGNPLTYNDMQPIKLSGVLNGTIGLLEGSGLYFHEKAVVSEDYWICALNAYKHRMCWIDSRFSVVGAKTFGNPGGCASYRTKDQEKADTLFLRQVFGEAIAMKEDTALARRKHEYQRTLRIPF